jgi:hypothetical protein
MRWESQLRFLNLCRFPNCLLLFYYRVYPLRDKRDYHAAALEFLRRVIYGVRFEIDH